MEDGMRCGYGFRRSIGRQWSCDMLPSRYGSPTRMLRSKLIVEQRCCSKLVSNPHESKFCTMPFLTPSPIPAEHLRHSSSLDDSDVGRSSSPHRTSSVSSSSLSLLSPPLSRNPSMKIITTPVPQKRPWHLP